MIIWTLAVICSVHCPHLSFVMVRGKSTDEKESLDPVRGTYDHVHHACS
jgi:hypothetical protein